MILKEKTDDEGWNKDRRECLKFLKDQVCVGILI